MMGISFLTLFVANNLIGWIGTFYATMTPLSFWSMHAAIAAAGGILVLVFGPVLRRTLEPHATQGLRPAAMTEEIER
jgi:POT family proton-dependent oligopeptide transporter